MPGLLSGDMLNWTVDDEDLMTEQIDCRLQSRTMLSDTLRCNNQKVIVIDGDIRHDTAVIVVKQRTEQAHTIHDLLTPSHGGPVSRRFS